MPTLRKLVGAVLLAALLLIVGPVMMAWPAEAAFPGTNGKITFQSDRNNGPLDVFVINSDGNGETNLTNNPASDAVPEWSPDGTKIAFLSDRDGSGPEIYVMNADGSNPTRLTNNSAWDGYPTWSPDGSKITFQSNRDGNFEIYVMNADGSSQTRLTNNAADDFHPAWSPNESKIAFDSVRDGNTEVYVMNTDGTGQTNLTNNPAEEGQPNWSPDGSKIVCSSDRDGNAEIYVMNADGSGQTNLTNNLAGDAEATWSPDGSRIAFQSNRDGNFEVYVMNADGSLQTRLTNNPAADGSPDWQPLSLVTTITMGRQAMEGDLKVSVGDTLRVGYDFTMPGSHPAARVGFVGGEVTFLYTCVGSLGSGSFVVPMTDQTYADLANSSAWYPSGDQHNPVVYQGSIVIPSTLCGSGLVRLNQGGTFSSGVTASPSGYKVNVRWHYSANGSAGGWSGTKSIVPN